jgi:Flp pilus assembly protein TadB
MTTTENTPVDTTRAPVMGFKNPTNWVVGPAAGSIAAGLLVGWMTFIPTWAVWVVVAGVALWALTFTVDQAKRRKAVAK